MRKLIISLHVSLDGFVAGPKGEMDWIKLDEEMFDMVARLTDEADTALYSRVTYEMMENYWPNAANLLNASKHDIEHSNWYNRVEKVILSKTMKDIKKDKTAFISDDAAAFIKKLKEQPGKNILVFGSPGAVHVLMVNDLIDEYWLFVNPVILGEGIPLFTRLSKRSSLTLVTSKAFAYGVVALHYKVSR